MPFPGAARRLLNLLSTDGGVPGVMKKSSRSNRITNVVSLQVAREQRGASNRLVSKRSNQRLLERLEAENAQLRGSVVDLMLQIQALRDGSTSRNRF